MKKIEEMSSAELLGLNPGNVTDFLMAGSIIRIAQTLGAFWRYDYEAAKQGRIGNHAILESGSHSNGLFDPSILLASRNIRHIMAEQMMYRLIQVNSPCPDWVADVQNRANMLGEEVAMLFGTNFARMDQEDGQPYLATAIGFQDQVLLVEESFSTGASFEKAVQAVSKSQPNAVVLPYIPVILNRNGARRIVIEGAAFQVLSLIEWRIQDFEPGSATCPLCALGSVAINPRESEEKRLELIGSQL